MNKNNLVSVLIPAYNHEKYVQETIQSVIEQTYENIELIIIDDGSKDNTWQKIQEMKEVCEKRFTRIHFETKKNEGICTTLNKLLSLANGEYVGIIASDDKYKPMLIEKELDFLSKNPDYVLCTCDDEIMDTNSQICYWDKKRNNVYNISEAVYKTFGELQKKTNKNINFNSEQYGTYSSLYIRNYLTNGKLIRKSIINKIGNCPDGVFEDWWLVLQLSKYGKFKYLDEVLFSYRWHNNNTIKNIEKNIKCLKNTLLYENKILSEINLNEVTQDVRDAIKNGIIYRKYISIPYIFEILLKRMPDKLNKRSIIIKILNVKICEFSIHCQDS